MIRLDSNSVADSVYSIGSVPSSNAASRTSSQHHIKIQVEQHQDAQARKEKLIDEKNFQQE